MTSSCCWQCDAFSSMTPWRGVGSAVPLCCCPCPRGPLPGALGTLREVLLLLLACGAAGQKQFIWDNGHVGCFFSFPFFFSFFPPFLFPPCLPVFLESPASISLSNANLGVSIPHPLTAPKKAEQTKSSPSHYLSSPCLSIAFSRCCLEPVISMGTIVEFSSALQGCTDSGEQGSYVIVIYIMYVIYICYTICNNNIK